MKNPRTGMHTLSILLDEETYRKCVYLSKLIDAEQRLIIEPPETDDQRAVNGLKVAAALPGSLEGCIAFYEERLTAKEVAA